MEQFIFLVQGSAPEPYRVTFKRDGSNLSAYCTCPAGENGQYCKHRFALLSGNIEAVVSQNIEDAKRIATWLPGTDVEKALQEVQKAEQELEKAQKHLSSVKKQLAAAFRD